MNDAASQPKADEPDPAEPSGSPSLRERANARSAASVSLACLIAALVGVPAIGGLAYGVGGRWSRRATCWPRWGSPWS